MADPKTASWVVPLAFAISSIVAYSLCTTIYRLFFSPLSRIPGPWLTRISSIPEANSLKEQRRTQWVTSLFEQHPDAVAVRTAPKSVSFNHPDAVKAIYGSPLPLPPFPPSAARTPSQTCMLTHAHPPRPREGARRIRKVQLVRRLLDDGRVPLLHALQAPPRREAPHGRPRLQRAERAGLRAVC